MTDYDREAEEAGWESGFVAGVERAIREAEAIIANPKLTHGQRQGAEDVLAALLKIG